MASKLSRCTPALVALAALLLLAGCGGVKKVAVSGAVSYDNQPVDQGTIRFTPADGVGPTDGAVIQAGKYSAVVTPGKKSVHIEGHRQKGMRKHDANDPSSPMVPDYEVIVTTDVDAEVTSGKPTLDFALPKQ